MAELPPALLTPEPEDVRVGELLAGRYRVIAPLDSGGTARVYLAIQEPLGREVAIKLLRPDMESDHQHVFEPRFFREAAALGALSHPNLVTVHDYGVADDGACFVVMERLRGRTLRQALADGPMPEIEAVRLVIGISRGLLYVHQQGLVHRDVKPSNVFLVRDERGVEQPKLLDFGLVKDLRVSENTSVGTFLGTPHYVAPEQATGRAVDARADLYALGVLTYRMLAGLLPYEAHNAMAVALAHIREPYPPIRKRAPQVRVDAALEAIVKKMMAKEPADRQADAAVVIASLEAWSKANVSRGTTIAPRFRPPPGPVAALGATLAMIGVGLGFWIGTPATSQERVAPEEPRAGAEMETPGSTPPDVSPPAAASQVAAPSEIVVSAPADGTAPVATSPARARPEPPPAPTTPAPKPSPKPATPKTTAAKAPTAAAGAAGVYDGVVMDADQAARALKFLNTASEAELRAAGVYGRGVSVVLEHRPFASLQAAADTPYIGEKTLLAARGAQ